MQSVTFLLGKIPPLQIDKRAPVKVTILNRINPMISCNFIGSAPPGLQISTDGGNSVIIEAMEFAEPQSLDLEFVDTSDGTSQKVPLSILSGEFVTVSSMAKDISDELFLGLEISEVDGDGINGSPSSIKAQEVVLVGTTLVLSENNGNQLYNLLHCKNLGLDRNVANDPQDPQFSECNRLLKSLSIRADRLVINSPINLPATNIEIYAREIEFGVNGSLSTTPCFRNFSPLSPESVGLEQGANGLSAGTIKLSVDRITLPNDSQKRLILDGGSGQVGAPGGLQPRQPEPIPSMKVTINSSPVDATLIIDTISGAQIFGSNKLPKNGTDAKLATRPGFGGSGGAITCSPHLQSQVTKIASFSIGKSGSVAPTTLGGLGQEPRNAYWLGFLSDQTYAVQRIHKSMNGNDAPGLAAQTPIPPPTTGLIQFDDALRTAWLDLTLIARLESYLNDLFLANAQEKVLALCSEYMRIFRAWVDDRLQLSDAQMNFQQFVESMYLKAAAGEDAYGHVSGWYPSITLAASFGIFVNAKSLVVSLVNFERYLRAEAKEAKLDLLNSSLITETSSSYQSVILLLVSEISRTFELEKEIRENENEIDLLIVDLLSREADLKEQAIHNVEVANDSSMWSTGLKTLSAVAKLSPIGQPYAAAAGVGLDILAGIVDGNASVDTIVNGAVQAIEIAMAEGDTQDAATYFSNFETAFEAITSSAATAESIEVAYKFLSEEIERAKKISVALKTHLKNSGISQNIVTQELHQLRKNDRYLGELITTAKRLTERKATLIACLTANHQERLKLSSQLALIGEELNQMYKIRTQNVLDHLQLKHVDSIVLAQRSQLIQDFLKLQYWLIKSYEARFCKPYTGSYFVATEMKKILDAAFYRLPESDDQIDNFVIDMLKIPAREIIRELRESAVEDGKTSSQSILITRDLKLTEEECRKLSGEGLKEIEIYLPARIEWLQDQEFRRIESVAVKSGEVQEHEEIYFNFRIPQEFNVFLRQTQYRFRKSAFETLPIVVSSGTFKPPDDYINDTAIENDLQELESELSDFTTSDAGRDTIFNLPGLEAWLTVAADGPSGIPRSIKQLKLEVTFRTLSVPNTKRVLLVSSRNIENNIPIMLSRSSIMEHGNTPLLRSLRNGETVTVSVEAKWSGKVFDRWVHSTTGVLISDEPSFELQMTENKQIEPIFK